MCRKQDARTLADRQDIQREQEDLWQFHLKRLKTGAPIDQLFDRAIFSQKPPLHLVQCNGCGTVYRNPREQAAELLQTYEDEEPNQAALASLFEQQRAFFDPRVKHLSRLVDKSGRVLEVGSYVGGFLLAATEAGWDATGLDINANANAFARSRGANVVEASLDDYAPADVFDVVALWNCFDQLPDPHAAMASASRLLAENGLIAIRVPNGDAYARLHESKFPFVRQALAWNNLATFPYRHGFTPGSLTKLLNDAGYRVVDVALDALVPISGPWTRPWAKWEERITKRVIRFLKTDNIAPWFEVYARREH